MKAKRCTAPAAGFRYPRPRHIHAMSVIPITIFFSLLLVAFFVGLFWREQRARRFGGLERDSLLPLAEETPRSAHLPAPAPTAEQDDVYF